MSTPNPKKPDMLPIDQLLAGQKEDLEVVRRRLRQTIIAIQLDMAVNDDDTKLLRRIAKRLSEALFFANGTEERRLLIAYEIHQLDESIVASMGKGNGRR